MSGFSMTPDQLAQMTFSVPYMDTTAALIVEDYRKNEFDSIEKVQKKKYLHIAISSRDKMFRKGIKRLYPNAKVVMLDSPLICFGLLNLRYIYGYRRFFNWFGGFDVSNKAGFLKG
jgi:hypothetical protein